MFGSRFGITSLAVLLSLFFFSSVVFAQFTDIGASLSAMYGSNLAWGDYDNDGDLDLAFGSSDVTKIYSNSGGTFVDSGVQITGVGDSIAWGDYDNDGDLDLALTGYECNKIYRNTNGTFTDIGAVIGATTGSSIAWGDYDNDGDLDLVIAGTHGYPDESHHGSASVIYRNNGGKFQWISTSGVAGATLCSLDWGDYDNDGDLDVAVAGNDGYYTVTTVSKICRNTNGTFTDIGAGITGVYVCSLDWGDYDNDGDLDLAVAGLAGTTPVSKIYRNTNGTFADIGAGIVGVRDCSLDWGDYDNDGDLDIAIAGYTGTTNISRIYRNDGGTFTDIATPLVGVRDGSLAWGDYDNDGDLDLAIAGNTGSTNVSKIYRNDCNVANTAPAAPTGLTSTINGLSVSLSWNAASDAQTPASGLSYNIRIGTVPGKDDVYSGMADTSTGSRRLPAIGNAQKRLSWTLKGFKVSPDYYWSVQAVDTSYAGSLWAAEQQITLTCRKITGYVYAFSGAALADATVMTDDGSSSAVTDSSGYYELLVRDGWSGSITPSKYGNNFTPASRSFSNVTSDLTGQNFDSLQFAYTDLNLPGIDVRAIAWGDYDDDGDLDLAAGGFDSSMNSITRIYRNDSDVYTYAGVEITGLRSIYRLAWGDYDNDGDLDLVIRGANSSSQNVSRIYRNNSGTFAYTGVEITGSGSPTWGDYDNDGDLDLAIADSSGTRIYRNVDGSFIDAGAGIPGVSGVLAWGDYDNDGDLDLAMAGSIGTTNISRIYRNTNGTFADIGAGLTGVIYSSLAWGDYDNDGDLDLALAGWDASYNNVCKIYRNDGGAFADIGASLTGAHDCSLAWADYDNDGDLDLVLAAYSSKVYRNTNGIFADAEAGITGLSFRSFDKGDYDNDGDVDLIIIGSDYITYSGIYKIYRNDCVIANSVPTAPTGLTSAVNGSSITFSWNAASDAQTPASGLSYNLRIGKTPGGSEIFSGMANSYTGHRHLAALGNAQKRLSWTLTNLPAGTFYWSVQAIDPAYAGSAWAAEQPVTLTDTAPPVVSSVVISPDMAAGGDIISATVQVADNTGVTEVFMDGVPMNLTPPNTWTLSFTADLSLGIHTVVAIARDAAGNTGTGSGSYKTAQIVSTPIKNTANPIMTIASDSFLFKFWGLVSKLDANRFQLYDGSGKVIWVEATGHTLQTGNYGTARGVLDMNTNPATLTSRVEWVRKLK